MDELDQEGGQPAKCTAAGAADAAGPAAPFAQSARPALWRAEALRLREAWAGLPDNPLARYWLLARRRRAMRSSVLARHLPTLSMLALMAAVYLFVYLPQAAVYSSTRENLVVALYTIVLPTAFIWLLSGLHDALRDAATLLSRTERRLKPGQLDELLAVAPLSNHQLLAGALLVILPPLWLRIAVGAGLGWITLVTLSFADNGFQWDEKLLQALTLAPLTIGAISLSGMLGGSALALLAVVMGHRTRHSMAAGIIAGVLAVWPLLWLAISTPFAMSFNYSDNRMPALPWILAAIAVFLGVLLLSLRVAASTRLTPAAALPGVPLGLLLAVAVSIIALDIWDYAWSSPLGEYLLPNLVWTWGCFAPLSPLAIPSPLCWGDDKLASGFFSFGHVGLLLALQAAVVALLCQHALIHLAQRRREMG